MVVWGCLPFLTHTYIRPPLQCILALASASLAAVAAMLGKGLHMLLVYTDVDNTVDTGDTDSHMYYVYRDLSRMVLFFGQAHMRDYRARVGPEAWSLRTDRSRTGRPDPWASVTKGERGRGGTGYKVLPITLRLCAQRHTSDKKREIKNQCHKNRIHHTAAGLILSLKKRQ